MTLNGWGQFLLYFGVLLVLMRPVGVYMARLFSDELRFLRPIERVLYRLCGIDATAEMNWREYTIAMLMFNTVKAAKMRRAGLQRVREN